MALRGQHAQPFADRVFAAKPALVLESLGELHGRVEMPAGGFFEEQVEDHIALAIPLGIVLGTDLFAHQAFVYRVQLNPLAIHLVDKLGRESGPVAQLDLQLTLRVVLVGAMQDQAGGVEAAQRAGTGEREKRIVLHLLLAELLGVMDQDDPAIGVDVVAQDLNAFLQKEYHGGVVVLAAASTI
jgi:hypothetical protein